MGSHAATGCPLASTCWRLIDHARKPLPRALPAHLSTTNTHRFPRPVWKTSAPVVPAAGRQPRTPTRKHRGQFLTTAENPCRVSLAPGCPQQTPIALHARCGKPHARVDKKSPRPESLAVVGLRLLVHTKPPRLSTSGVENRTGRFLDSEEPASGRHYLPGSRPAAGTTCLGAGQRPALPAWEPASGRHYLLGSLHGHRPIVWGGCGWVGGTLHRMDAVEEPARTYWRRVPPTHPHLPRAGASTP